MINRLSTYLYLRPKVILALLILPPLLWFLVVYIGSLLSMLVNSFFYLDGFTGKVVHEFTFRTYAKLLDPTNLQIFLRTTVMAASVTVACVIIAFPLSYYMARFASGRMKTFLYLAVTLPLWSSYVVRVYSWKLILAQEGIVSWFSHFIHLDWLLDLFLRLPVIGGPSLSVSATGIFIVFVYIWLPYMIIPIHVSLERVPKSLIEASGDLGATQSQTFRFVLLPLSSSEYMRVPFSPFRLHWVISLSRSCLAIQAITLARRYWSIRERQVIFRWLLLLPWGRSLS